MFNDVCRSHLKVSWCKRSTQVCRQKLFLWGQQRTENYWKILGTSHRTAKKERSDHFFSYMRLPRFLVPDLAVANRVFTIQSSWHKHRQTAIVIVWKERLTQCYFFCYLILPFVEPLPQAVLINKTCICHPWTREQTSFWTVWWTLLYLESRHAH